MDRPPDWRLAAGAEPRIVPASSCAAPIISCGTALAAFAVIPWGNGWTIHGYYIRGTLVNVPISLILIFALGSIGIYGFIVGGWASESKFSILGSMRTCAQLVSYEVSLALSVLGVVILGRSLSLTDIVHREVEALVAEGAPYVQIDSIRYVFDYTDEERRLEWQALGIDPDRAIDETIDADNAVVAAVARKGVTFGLHMCRGNNRSRWFAEGGYDRVAEKVFGQLDYDRFLLEYDSERAGGFEPLRHVPKGKTVVLGLISTKAPALESQQDLLRRIDEASKYVPIANLALSPQCGFASVAAGNEISWDDQRRKLDLLVEIARKVWGG